MYSTNTLVSAHAFYKDGCLWYTSSSPSYISQISIYMYIYIYLYIDADRKMRSKNNRMMTMKMALASRERLKLYFGGDLDNTLGLTTHIMVEAIICGSSSCDTKPRKP